MPPKSTVPPSGTLTVVEMVVKMNVGNWTVVPSRVVTSLSRPCSSPSGSVTMVPVSLDDRPSKVNSCTGPIRLKNGTKVSRTKRRSDETTACTLSCVPSFSTTMTGCCAAAKSPTTGMILVTKGRCDWSWTLAVWPLNNVTLGACSTLVR